MVKRPSDYGTDDSESIYATSSKRARTTDSDEGDEEVSRVKRESKTNHKGKGKSKARKDEGEDDEDGQIEQDELEPEDEDKRAENFEREHREKIMAELKAKHRTLGGIAEHGILEFIEMHSFMCHKYLTFEFGPQINFIIGHNGSGKSAVLSAITVALGGKSASTGRGSGLKSFIKEGSSVAEVTISLKNQGEEAFKPKEYGKSIVITRRFTKEGSSTWKIKSKSGAVISTKKEELSAICDHMNIQVDNPMNVLTQDAARQFLSASLPADKYKLFLRGTQLSQLSEEYDLCFSNIQKTFKMLALKKEALPDLRTAFRDATVRFEEAAKAREQKQKADTLKKELAWAHVRGKEEEMTAKFQEVAKLEARLPRLQAKIDEATAVFNTATAEVAARETEVTELGNIDELTQRKTDFQNQIRANKTILSDFTADLKRMDQSMSQTTKQMAELDIQIAAENERMAAHTQAKHDEMQQRLGEARDEVNAAESAYHALQSQASEQNNNNESLRNRGEEFQSELKRIQGQIQSCQGMIERATQAQKNSLAPYGKNIKEVLERIETMRWYGDKPLGPLGLYVKAKDPQKWGQLLRSQLGNFLTAFAVSHPKDRVELKKLLDQTQNRHVQVIINERDMFDYSRGEPPEDYLTVLRALEISDPYVLRVLINQVRIERQHLSLRREEGEKILRTLPGGGSMWTADGFSVRVFPEGGSSSSPLNLRSERDGTSLLLTGRDPDSQIRLLQEELRQHEQAYADVLSKNHSVKTSYMSGRQAHDAIKAKQTRAGDALRRAKNALANLQQEANDELPTGVASFQAAKAEAEEEKKNVTEQFEDVMRQKGEVDEKQKVLLGRVNELKRRIDEFMELVRVATTRTEDAVERRVKAQSDLNHYKKKFDEEKKKVEAVQEVAAVLQEEFTNWTAKASEYCERVENPRKAEVVKRNLESVQHALGEREKRQGATVEEMTVEVNKAKARLEAAERDLKQMTALNKALKNSLIVRLQRWQEFRRHIALRCKLVFGFHLSHRGYYGKVLFNHDAETLVLKVQTDDQVGTQSSLEKDPRSLSGGEKSFSTICLLLSLWESIGCPLRCLDEFDVFMDAVNRRISMKLMIDTANSSDKKQYILITPQDMGNVQLGPTVKVNRMIDPERAQRRGS